MKQFALWMEDAIAAALPEPNAMVLTTLGDWPHARTVLLKSHDDDGFTFYTNRTSRKGSDLAGDPRCCAVFPWYALGRQVTVEGSGPATVPAGERAVLSLAGTPFADRGVGEPPVDGPFFPGRPRRPGRGA